MAASGAKGSRKSGVWRLIRHLRLRPRFSASAAIFLALAGAFVAAGMRPSRSLLLAFDIAAAIFLVATGVMFTQVGPERIRSIAAEQDEGRWGFLWSGVVVSLIALVALSVELDASKGGSLVEIGLAATSLLLSWLFMNTVFALHYAHAFYREGVRGKARLEFPGTDEPDYWDFAYFAAVIGMTFQVSDVQITDRSIRHVALAQSIIAFFFNVIIIALSVNVVAGRA
ncbi:MAG: DUF1345 domain-containing protein [Rudaea sp.]|nr:DUF1345 domain-containing protein [Rudaea sp.]